MRIRNLPLYFFLATALVYCGCAKKSQQRTEIRSFAADNTVGVIDRTSVSEDANVTADGGGSLRVDAAEPVTIRLYEIDHLDFDDALVVYRAQLRARQLDGDAYLEMWCHFADRGDYFSRDVENPISGTTDWVHVETPFTLQKGQVVASIRLNLVILGRGTVWIDDIHLERESGPE